MEHMKNNPKRHSSHYRTCKRCRGYFTTEVRFRKYCLGCLHAREMERKNDSLCLL